MTQTTNLYAIRWQATRDDVLFVPAETLRDAVELYLAHITGEEQLKIVKVELVGLCLLASKENRLTPDQS